MINKYYSETSSILSIAFVLMCIVYTLLCLIYNKKKGLSLQQSVTLPSILIPILLLILYGLPLLFSIHNSNFYTKYASYQYLNQTVSLIVWSSLIFFIGIFFGKTRISSISRRRKLKILTYRKLDLLVINKKYTKLILSILIIFSILLVPLYFGLNIELIWQGGRSYGRSGPIGLSDNPFLRPLIPFSIIFTLILSIVGGIYYSYQKKPIIFIIPLMAILPKLATLSRAFIIPLILFIFPLPLLGIKINRWVYSLTIASSVITPIAILSVRGFSTGGLTGFVSSMQQINIGITYTFINFLEDNSNIGLLSQAIAFKDVSQHFIDGFIKWILTISPIPTFFDITLVAPPSIASLLGKTNVGLPMPVLGELYYQMGWLGITVLFIIGYWLGKLEAKLIIHISVFGKAYWPNVLLWLSFLYCFILSFHSASRASSRVFLYSLLMISLLNFILPANKSMQPFLNNHLQRRSIYK